MQLVDQFYNVPGTCFFTGSSDVNGPIIDTDTFVENRGRIYIGPAFLQEACRLIGWRHPEEVELVNLENESLKAEVARLTAELGDKQNLEKAILDAAAQIQKPPVFSSPATPAPFSRGT